MKYIGLRFENFKKKFLVILCKNHRKLIHKFGNGWKRRNALRCLAASALCAGVFVNSTFSFSHVKDSWRGSDLLPHSLIGFPLLFVISETPSSPLTRICLICLEYEVRLSLMQHSCPCASCISSYVWEPTQGDGSFKHLSLDNFHQAETPWPGSKEVPLSQRVCSLTICNPNIRPYYVSTPPGASCQLPTLHQVS